MSYVINPLTGQLDDVGAATSTKTVLNAVTGKLDYVGSTARVTGLVVNATTGGLDLIDRPLDSLISFIRSAIPDLQFLYVPEHAVLTGGVVTSLPGVVGAQLAPISAPVVTRVGKVLRSAAGAVAPMLSAEFESTVRYTLSVTSYAGSIPATGHAAALHFNTGFGSGQILPLVILNGASQLNEIGWTHTLNGSVSDVIPTSLTVVESLIKSGASANTRVNLLQAGGSTGTQNTWKGDVGLVLGATTVPSAGVRAELRARVAAYHEIAGVT